MLYLIRMFWLSVMFWLLIVVCSVIRVLENVGLCVVLMWGILILLSYCCYVGWCVRWCLLCLCNSVCVVRFCGMWMVVCSVVLYMGKKLVEVNYLMCRLGVLICWLLMYRLNWLWFCMLVVEILMCMCGCWLKNWYSWGMSYLVLKVGGMVMCSGVLVVFISRLVVCLSVCSVLCMWGR